MASQLPFRRVSALPMSGPAPSRRAGGFSMVEMLVALVFTMVLMAGMASVFKASLSTFFTSGEALSGVRRNRLSIDLLGQDLDAAGMFLGNVVATPSNISTTCPIFFVLPNMAISGLPSSPSSSDPTQADQLYFYADLPLPFQGTLAAGVAAGTSTAVAQSYTVECNSATYAGMVAAGHAFIVKDAYYNGLVSTATVVNDTQVTVTTATDSNSGVTGDGSQNPSQVSHMKGAGVQFYQPAQMVRYSVQYLRLDPNSTDDNLVPCLVRDQGAYNASGFVATATQQIITENVTGFKIYLSVSPNLVATNDAGAWAGDPTTLGGTSSGLTGWQSLILGTTSPATASITTQLAAANPNATPPANDVFWFRDNPLLVRVDLTTRSAVQRTEFATTAGAAAYKLLTQSLIFVPRHSGLPMS